MSKIEKNRFSQMLEQLLTLAEIKNVALAKALQYDVSYISKWISGRMLPAEKTKRNVLHRISGEIIRLSSKSGKENLYALYQVENESQLENVIFDNLEAEYDYVQGMQKMYGASVEPKTMFFVELSPAQYISKMHHPVLRRVSRLHIMAEMDLLGLMHEYRLQIIQGDMRRNGYQSYPDVHFSLMIHLSPDKIKDMYDPIFLINMMADMARVDFRLYKCEQAAGRMIFTVKDDFMISGMLMNPNRCMSVTVSSDADNCNPLYYSIRDLCTRETLLYYHATMAEMLNGNDYVRSVLGLNQRWFVGHMTEHFLSDDLFEELLEQMQTKENKFDKGKLRYCHMLTKRAMEETKIEILFYSTAFSNFAVESKIDFFDHTIQLTVQQRERYIKHLLELCINRENLNFKLVYGRLTSDCQYVVTQCSFLSDEISYLRLNTQNGKNNLAILSHPDMKMIFGWFFDQMWSGKESNIFSDREEICFYIRQMIHRINIISDIKVENMLEILEPEAEIAE